MNHNRRPRRRSALRRPLGLLTVLAAAAALTACDFEVTNPGQTQDKFLNSPTAAQAIVDGAHRNFNDTWNEVARIMGSVTREIFPSGNTGNLGINVNERQGRLLVDEQSGQWNVAHNARWTAEAAIQRFQAINEDPETGSVDDEIVAEAHLWAGYANRMLGENYCQAVFDGGDIEPHTAYLERAVDQLTEAMQIASGAGAETFELAALGARASVHVNLGNWDQAVADADALLDADPDFVFQTEFSNSDQNQYNAIFFASENRPYKVHTTWNTFYEDYYTETGDPRTPWISHEGFPEGSFGVGPFGTVPWIPQDKYASRDAPADLTDAREMKLIKAEALLVQDEAVAGAMALINEVRTSTPGADLDPWQLDDAGEDTDLEAAWTLLMRERGIELWLEGRRAADRRRWAASEDTPWDLAVPGSLDVHELPSTSVPEHEKGSGTYLSAEMDICFPIPDSERETNPSVPTT